MCTMLPEERLGIAQVTYRQAVAAARAHSSPTTWRRLLTAAKNLAAARRDRCRSRGGPPESARGEQPPRPMGKVLRLRSRRLWHDLLSEWERSRRLMDDARRLVRRAAELTTAPDPKPDQPGG